MLRRRTRMRMRERKALETLVELDEPTLLVRELTELIEEDHAAAAGDWKIVLDALRVCSAALEKAQEPPAR
jgi:hypothetical protein